MSGTGEALVAVVMLVGLVGIVVPVLPGLLLVCAAGVAWAWLDGGGTARWSVVAAMTVLLVVGTTVKYAAPARTGSAAGAPRATLLLGVAGAVVGYFVIPVVGLLIGGVLAILVAELVRLGSLEAAWRSTRAVLVGIGIGMLVELVTGVLMVAVWVVGVAATG